MSFVKPAGLFGKQGWPNPSFFLIFALAAVFALAFASVCYYQMTGMKVDFYHESAYPMLYAQSNLDTGLPFTSRFSGREISPLSWPLVNTLVQLVLPVSLTAQSVACILFSIFVALTIFAFCRTARLSTVATLLLLTIMFISYSPLPSHYMWTDQVWVWPMNSYGVYDMFSLISLIFVVRLVQKYDIVSQRPLSFADMRITPLILCSCCWFFATGLDSMRGFVTISGPVLAAYAFDVILRWRDSPVPRVSVAAKYVALCGAAAALALVIIRHLTAGVPQPWQDPHKYFTIASPGELKDRMLAIPVSILQLFDAIPAVGTEVFSFYGIIKITTTLFVLLILLMPLVRIRVLKEDATIERLVIFKYFYIFVLLLITSCYGTSSGVPRYYLPVVYSGFLAFAFVLNDWVRSKRYGCVLLVCVLLVPSYIHSVHILTERNFSSYKKEKFYRMGQFLEQRDLTYGYGGPWSSNILTLWARTSGKVHLGLVDLAPFMAHRHGDKKWTDPEVYSGRTFIAAPQSDFAQSPKLQALAAEKSVETLRFEDFVINVYPYNVAVNLDKPFDASRCGQPPDEKYLGESLSAPIAGESYGLSCSGWGDTVAQQGIYLRPIDGNAIAYLENRDHRRSVQIEAMAWGDERQKADIDIFANGKKIGVLKPTKTLLHSVFELPESVVQADILTIDLKPETDKPVRNAGIGTIRVL